MKSIYLVRDLETDLYLMKDPVTKQIKAMPRGEPPLLPKEQALALALEFYGKDWENRCSMAEATVSEWYRHIGKKGGSVSSPWKTRQVRRNARMSRPKRRKKKFISISAASALVDRQPPSRATPND